MRAAPAAHAILARSSSGGWAFAFAQRRAKRFGDRERVLSIPAASTSLRGFVRETTTAITRRTSFFRASPL